MNRSTSMRQMILGTDWWTDCDDAVAVRLLAAHHRRNELRLLGIDIDACMPVSVPSLDAFLEQCGVRVPIGLDHTATDYGGQSLYQARLAGRPGKHLANAEAEDSIPFYRRLIAAAEGPVELLEIGFPQVLAALVESPEDAFSPLSGRELVQRKVEHLWIMAGKWDEPEGGREHNFCRTVRASDAAARLCAEWPTPITFLGWEVGHSVISGKNLPEDDPLRPVLADYGSPGGRCSWDPMLIELAAVGIPQEAGYRCVTGTASVEAETGRNFFRAAADGRHRFVVKLHPDAWYEEWLERALSAARME